MAKTRMLNTRFWSDTYISDLDPIEKLLFIYFLTNQYTNLCWIYELPLKQIALDTWIDKQEMLPKIIKRFSDWGKIYYTNWWVYIKNFQKYQNIDNPKIQKWIDREKEQIPSSILQSIIDIDSLSIPYVWDNALIPIPILIPKPIPAINIAFDDFRNLYDKKIDKDKCYKKWIKLSDVERAAALNHIPQYKLSQADKKFRKNPETYINNKAWNNEIITWGIDYTNIQNFHDMMMKDKVPELKQALWLEKYFEIKALWKQSPLYLSF